ncbi:MAG: hypothetical protein WAO52_07695 [Prolixibacteraceae bacterium]
MLFRNKKLDETISSTLYDLTHLEINTIIKEEMNATKAPSSPRLLLHDLAKKYHFELLRLGEIYEKHLEESGIETKNLFRGEANKKGSGYESYKELRNQAELTYKFLEKNKAQISVKYDQINSDIKMLQRIETISNDIMSILKIAESAKENAGEKNLSYDFDEPETLRNFRTMPHRNAEQYELDLDLRQLLVIKKANDIGTEKVVMQTIIGMDGDVTSRISKSFADQPIAFINDIHNDAIRISVKFWETLVNIVVKLGENIIKTILGKS